MTDNIVRMPGSRGTMLDPEAAQACTELLSQTIWLLDKQIERAEELLGDDPAHHFMRAIETHIVDKIGRMPAIAGKSVVAQLRQHRGPLGSVGPDVEDVRPNWKERSGMPDDWRGRPAMPGGEK